MKEKRKEEEWRKGNSVFIFISNTQKEMGVAP